MTPEMSARIDALIAQSQQWQIEGRCYGCGTPATHLVTLEWMGEGGRLYCTEHAAEWAQAGWARFVAPDRGGRGEV